MKILGYINHLLYTDIESFRVYQDDEGRIYAVRVEKVPVEVKPKYIPGGFSCICINNHEVFAGKCDIVEIGERREIKKLRGSYGYWMNLDTKIYGFTTSGKPTKTFKKLGKKIEKECRYWYDYNF